MDMYSTLLYFIAGGTLVTAAVLFAEIGNPFLSGIALMFPSITAVSYYFIGKNVGSTGVAATIKSTIISAFIVWLPYMITLSYLAPRMGVNKALAFSIMVFLIIGTIWITVNNKYGFI